LVRAGHDGHVAHRAAPNPTPSGDWRSPPILDRFQGHG
jgi:hypothetical protein